MMKAQSASTLLPQQDSVMSGTTAETSVSNVGGMSMFGEIDYIRKNKDYVHEVALQYQERSRMDALTGSTSRMSLSMSRFSS